MFFSRVSVRLTYVLARHIRAMCILTYFTIFQWGWLRCILTCSLIFQWGWRGLLIFSPFHVFPDIEASLARAITRVLWYSFIRGWLVLLYVFAMCTLTCFMIFLWGWQRLVHEGYYTCSFACFIMLQWGYRGPIHVVFSRFLYVSVKLTRATTRV